MYSGDGGDPTMVLRHYAIAAWLSSAWRHFIFVFALRHVGRH